jgi:hypothetical protein
MGKLESLLGCEVRPMTEDESRVLVTLLMTRDSGTITKFDADLRDKDVFPYLVLVGRLEAFKKLSPKLDIDMPVQILCGLLCDRPGNSVMWAYTLNEMFVKLGKKVTMGDWIEEFPNGVPTEGAYEKTWEAQKNRGANFIDDFGYWSLPA